eukprot:TRINITY_DN20106_c0_g1_i1.p2 TRINITY_DN20106_c0_g1~~TRINITY_DN20106_c0_g1_i1.p2  ORF type:complete len:514 (-),score=96.71 TRINITY_DN20106_c0_g1_i1:138-1679(-)
METVETLAKVEARLQAAIGEDSLPSSDEAAGTVSTASTANTGGDVNLEAAAAFQPLFAPRNKAAGVLIKAPSPEAGAAAAHFPQEPVALRAELPSSKSSEISPVASVTAAFRDAVANALRSSRTPSPQAPVSPGQAIPRSARLVRPPASLLLPSAPRGQDNSAPWRNAWLAQSLGHSPSSSSLRRRSREGSQGISPSASRRSLAGSEQSAAQLELATEVTLKDFIPSGGLASEEKARPLPVPSPVADSQQAEEAHGNKSTNNVDLQGPPKRSSSSGSNARRGGRSSSVGKQGGSSSGARGGAWLRPAEPSSAAGGDRKESSPDARLAEVKAAPKRSAGSRMLWGQQLPQREPPRAEQQRRSLSRERTSRRPSSPPREHPAPRAASPKRTSPPPSSRRADSIGRRSRDAAAAAVLTSCQASEVSRKPPEASRLDEEGPEQQELALIWSRPAIPSPLLEEEEEGEEDFDQIAVPEEARGERVTHDARQPSARSGGGRARRAQNQPARKPGRPWLF